MEQVVERFPQLLGSYTLENMEGKLEFLRSVGVPEDQLGKVGSSTFCQGIRVWFRVSGFILVHGVVCFIYEQQITGIFGAIIPTTRQLAVDLMVTMHTEVDDWSSFVCLCYSIYFKCMIHSTYVGWYTLYESLFSVNVCPHYSGGAEVPAASGEL
jgi:hypothetical protein